MYHFHSLSLSLYLSQTHTHLTCTHNETWEWVWVSICACVREKKKNARLATKERKKFYILLSRFQYILHAKCNFSLLLYIFIRYEINFGEKFVNAMTKSRESSSSSSLGLKFHIFEEEFSKSAISNHYKVPHRASCKLEMLFFSSKVVQQLNYMVFL